MNTSESINEIAKALSAAQANMENAGKNAVNPHFKNKYADLAEVLNVVRPALAAQGIALAQLTSTQGEVLVLHTRLIHTSGQWIESEYPVCKLPSAPQQMGAAMTYARRYSLASVCGIAQEDDDLADGKGTSQTPAPQKETKAEREARRRDLVAQGEEAANFSMEALQAWWSKTLTKDERSLVGTDALELLKTVATEAAKIDASEEAAQ